MIKILSVFGTRPEAIKMAPVVLALDKEPDIESIVCVSGQHKEMLEPILNVFDIKPDYNLNIMKPNQTLFDITTEILNKMQKILEEVKPDLVLVHGDTTTAASAALASYYMKIPVGHVEAGLRTGNIYEPFPEEYNRQSIGLIASLSFAPTQQAMNNLLSEGKTSSISVTGNTAIDALKTTVDINYTHPLLEKYKDKRILLLTAHRRESLGEPMRQMFKAIKRILLKNEDVHVIYPIHKNPKVREIADEVFGTDDRISIIEPLDVVDFHNFLNNAYIILTDSGGIQEEAPSLGKPVLVLRNQTERPEGIKAGTLKLVGTQEETIYEAIHQLLTDSSIYKSMSQASNPFGDGNASQKIVRKILEYFN